MTKEKLDKTGRVRTVIRLLTLALAISPLYIPKISVAESTIAPIPVRNFTLNLDKNILDIDSIKNEEVEGKLFEYAKDSSNIPSLLKNWKIKLEKKGQSRAWCQPPMFNLSFDKFDKEGNKKPLFNGRSTYSGFNTLEYQELRFVPDCDVWNDYNWIGDIGFGGKLSPLTREAFSNMTLRYFGIATPDIVGFADITFISSDQKYNNKTYRYLILQRINEQDDQIPFTKQFGLNTNIYESGFNEPYYISDSGNDRLQKISIFDSRDNKSIRLNLDIQNSSRLRIISEFIGLSDVWFFGNESYGTKLSNGSNIILPHSLDSSLPCTPELVSKNIGGYRGAMMQGNNPAVQKIYFDEFIRFFSDINNLNSMYQIVDSLPSTQTEKTMLKTYLKLRFHEFATYAISKDFAIAMNQPYTEQKEQIERKITLPFPREEGYQYAYNQFINSCGNKIIRSDVSVIVPTKSSKLNFGKIIPYEYSENTSNQTNYSIELKGNAEVKIINNGPDLKIRKNGAFDFKIRDKNGNKIGSLSSSNSTIKPQGISGEVGIYYILPSGGTATYQINLIGQVSGKDAPYGTELYFYLDKVDINNKTTPIVASKNLSPRLVITYPTPSGPSPSITSFTNNLILKD